MKQELIILLTMLINLCISNIGNAGEYYLPYGTHTIIIAPPTTSKIEHKVLDEITRYGTITLTQIEAMPTTATTIVYMMKLTEKNKEVNKKIEQKYEPFKGFEEFVKYVVLPILPFYLLLSSF